MVEAAEVLVLLGLGEGEGTGQRAGDGDLAGGRDGFDAQDGVLRPGNLVVLRRAFDGEAAGQVIGDLVGNDIAIVHIDGLCTLFLSDKGLRAAGLEEEGGEHEAFGCGSADGAFCIDDGDQICVGIVES